jgi:hypothetical protein
MSKMKSKAKSKSLLFILFVSGLVINFALAFVLANPSNALKSERSKIACDQIKDQIK